MQKRENIRKNIARLAAALPMAALLTACSMMETDRSDCPTGLYVSFVYDYNLQHSDMFRDHVGAVTLYAFDEQGRLAGTYDEANDPEAGHTPLKPYGYQMHIGDLPAGQYSFIALAHQRSYDETLANGGANYRRHEPGKGEQKDALQVTLDRTPAVAPTRSAAADRTDAATYRVENEGLPMDTLWHGMTTRTVEVSPTKPTYDTVSLVRDTKMLTITLHELDKEAEKTLDIADYDICIVDNNGTLGHDNSLLPDDDIVYTPYATWNSEARDDNDNLTDRSAHACLMFNRLMYHPESADANAQLLLRHRTTGKEVAINLPYYLAIGRNAYELRRYAEQEYLDRAYDYKLAFYLSNGRWQAVEINILSWSKRIQLETL